MSPKPNDDRFIGKPLDGLSLAERTALAGQWIAEELYSPQRLPLQTIEAVGTNARECVATLRRRGLNPARYHYKAVELQ